jgi:hypothetical protein
VHCTKCRNIVSETNNFCGNCGWPIPNSNCNEGDGSINMAGSNSISNSNFHVGDVYQIEPLEEKAYIERSFIKPIAIGRSPVKTSWLIVSGLVSFIGSLASIFSVLGDSWQFLFFVVLALSMFLLFNGVILWRTRFSRLKWFNLESNKDGEVFLTKVSGNCPKCDGALRLVDLKVSQSSSSKSFVRCSRNTDHIWNFDHTVLD